MQTNYVSHFTSTSIAWFDSKACRLDKGSVSISRKFNDINCRKFNDDEDSPLHKSDETIFMKTFKVVRRFQIMKRVEQPTGKVLIQNQQWDEM